MLLRLDLLSLKTHKLQVIGNLVMESTFDVLLLLFILTGVGVVVLEDKLHILIDITDGIELHLVHSDHRDEVLFLDSGRALHHESGADLMKGRVVLLPQHVLEVVLVHKLVLLSHFSDKRDEVLYLYLVAQNLDFGGFVFTDFALLHLDLHHLVKILIKFLSQMLNLTLHGAVPVVLDGVVGAAFEHVGIASPLIFHPSLKQKEDPLLLFGPIRFLVARIEVVVPPLAAMLALAARQVLGDLRPLLDSDALYEGDQLSVLIDSPHPLL